VDRRRAPGLRHASGGRTRAGVALTADRALAAVVVAVAALAADGPLRQVAAGLPEGRWCAPAVDPPAVLGALTAVVAAALFVTAAPPALVPAEAALAPILVVASAIDRRCHRLPDLLTLPAAALMAAGVAIAAGVDDDLGLLAAAIGGAVILAGTLFVVHLVSPAGMGFGDVKLAVPIGLVVGARGTGTVLAALLAALVLGAVAGLVTFARYRDRRRPFAFGPCLGAGAVLALLVQ
jgi:leader peptidase (prepilin peptidase)/N-methyltransferase